MPFLIVFRKKLQGNFVTDRKHANKIFFRRKLGIFLNVNNILFICCDGEFFLVNNYAYKQANICVIRGKENKNKHLITNTNQKGRFYK